jgi:hypothetical protein
MKNFAALLVIALLAVVVLIFVTNPDLLGKIWLYIIGFIGYILALADKGIKSIGKAFQGEPSKPAEPIPASAPRQGISVQGPTTVSETEKSALQQKIHELEKQLQQAGDKLGEPLGKATLTLLRYMDDGETTLGLFFLRNKFFAYALEDTHRDEKIKGKTRIPEGLYEVGFSPVNSADSRITRDYQGKYAWFTKHIHLKNVPGFEGIYIHIGNTHEHTDGCILIADGINVDVKKALRYSEKAYGRFYRIVTALVESNEQVTIQVLNENWFDRSKLIKT